MTLKIKDTFYNATHFNDVVLTVFHSMNKWKFSCYLLMSLELQSMVSMTSFPIEVEYGSIQSNITTVYHSSLKLLERTM